MESFKGSHPELKGKGFLKGPLQAAKYDEVYNTILTHVGTKYDHMVYKALEYKDRKKDINLLSKSKTPMTTKVIQVATVGEDSIMVRKEITCIDKTGEEYTKYSLCLKQYMTDLTKFNSDLEKFFGLILGKCSPSIQSLAGEKEFNLIKETSKSIGLIKMIKRVCYNY